MLKSKAWLNIEKTWLFHFLANYITVQSPIRLHLTLRLWLCWSGESTSHVGRRVSKLPCYQTRFYLGVWLISKRVFTNAPKIWPNAHQLNSPIKFYSDFIGKLSLLDTQVQKYSHIACKRTTFTIICMAVITPKTLYVAASDLTRFRASIPLFNSIQGFLEGMRSRPWPGTS